MPSFKGQKQFQGIGANPAATHEAIQTPKAALQPMTAAGTPTPAVIVPKVKPGKRDRKKIIFTHN